MQAGVLPSIHVPWPKQREVLWHFGLDPDYPPPGFKAANQILMAGQAGGGKSVTARMLACLMALHFPKSKGAIFREHTRDIKRTQMAPMAEEMAGTGLGHMNMTDRIFHWTNGSTTEFNHCESVQDYKSHQWDWLAIEESTELSWGDITYLIARVRAPKDRVTDFVPRVLFTTNPGGQSHLQHKVTFVEGHRSGEPWDYYTEVEGAPPIRRVYVRITLDDNPSLDAPTYRAQLSEIDDPDLRRAALYGDWDINQGNFFWPFRRDRHVIPAHEIPLDWPRMRGYDWGSASPFACVWVARNPGLRYPDYTVYRELTMRHVATARQALLIRNLSRHDPSMKTYADPQIWTAISGQKSTTIAAELMANAPELRWTKANNRRVPGWSKINGLLDWADGQYEPRLHIMDNCPEVINQLANTQRDLHDPEDIFEPTNAGQVLRDDCLVGSTRIMTPRGVKPMSEMKAGDEVWTRGGWRSVMFAWKKDGPRDCLRVQLSNGGSLIGTPEHRIWVEGVGWTQIDALRYGDILSAWQMQKSSSSMASSSVVTQNQSGCISATITRRLRTLIGRGLDCCTARFGKQLMGQSRWGVTFTTGTETRLTTLSRIWNVCRGLSTVTCMDCSPRVLCNWLTWKLSVLWPLSGINQRRVERRGGRLGFMPGIHGNTFLMATSASSVATDLLQLQHIPTRGSAPTAASQPRGEQPALTMLFDPACPAGSPSLPISTPIPSAALVYVVSVSAVDMFDVYDLSVDDEDYTEFVADGVLVHNCIESLRYSIVAGTKPNQPARPQTYAMASVVPTDRERELERARRR